ncbi:MAG: ATP-dependent DNA helicase RecG [Spirochaeta sp.]|nr:ATP-dependent DNA helicase RecG [Spirochaeta sp.]
MILSELQLAPGKLPGIGPARRADLQRLGVSSVAELLLLSPRSYEDRSTPCSIARSRPAAEPAARGLETPTQRANTYCTVVAHDYIRTSRGMVLKVLLRDSEGTVGALLCFGRNFLANKLPVGSEILLSAVFRFQYGEFQSSEFEFVQAPPTEPETTAPPAPAAGFFRIEPIYPLSGGLSQTVMRAAVRSAIEQYAQNLSDELPEELRVRRGLPTRTAAITMLHSPSSIDEANEARRRFAYDELLVFQLALGREVTARPERPPIPPSDQAQGRAARLIAALPFEPTTDQETVLEEIRADASGPTAMLRLVQGEVGSGKTLVAFLAALDYIDAGRQVAFLAPTELLARQHAQNATRLLLPLQVRVEVLTGSLPAGERKRVQQALALGTVDLVIGTHALLSEHVAFDRLGLVVIDEQHRFGVLQRAALTQKAKSEAPDLLLMTATPIPRTLALTLYGELDISSIHTKPVGRLPVKTHLASSQRADEVYARVRALVDQGTQAYFVYPLIEAGANGLALRDAVGMQAYLSSGAFAGVKVGLIHSRMPEADKIEVMRSFAAGETPVLVATSVVEVGVDVPAACCIVIEHAERFGLSALHQLRGRVGRGSRPSYAFLIYDEPLTDDAKSRLRTLYEEHDGFAVAERDLQIRGPGDLSGIRQSGFLGFRFARFPEHEALLQTARLDARELLIQDEDLAEDAHKPLSRALELFLNQLGGAP